VFSPMTRATQPKRARLVELMKKHQLAVLEALDKINPHAHPAFDADLFTVCLQRLIML